MKKLSLIFATFLNVALVYGQSPDSWTQKADFGGIPRWLAVGFSIGNKAYLGIGALDPHEKDFWEYDAISNTWTQKANFEGDDRQSAVGFSIGKKGYLGTGGFLKDFWEYDPALNKWTQKADFGGTPRRGAVGFSISGKGYLGTGLYNSTKQKDFWEYDPATNAWTKKADFGGTAREFAVGFSIGGKGYVGTGTDGDFKNDFWEFDPISDTWSQRADFQGTARSGATGFSIVNKGYIGTGSTHDNGFVKDFWEYDPATNTWTLKADFGGTERIWSVGFNIGTKGYVGTGYDVVARNDFWEYTPECNGFTFYTDADGDLYGDISNNYFASDCILSSGYVADSTDCDDANVLTYPGATEIMNGVDDNCNGTIDDVICNTPTALLTKNITPTSAKFKWEPEVAAVSYKLRYKISTSGAWTLIGPTGHTKTVDGLSANTKYVWQIKSVCGGDPKLTSDWSEKQFFTTALLKMDRMSEQSIFEIYPNPAKDYISIQFNLTTSSSVSISLCDVSGRIIKTLLDENMNPDSYKLEYNTTNLSKGIYIVRIITVNGMDNQKLIIQ